MSAERTKKNELRGILPKECQCLPPNLQKSAAKILTGLQEMVAWGPWEPQVVFCTLEGINQMTPQISEFAYEAMNSAELINPALEKLRKALNSAPEDRQRAYGALWRLGYLLASDAGWDVYDHSLPFLNIEPVGPSAWDAGQTLAWEALKDQPGLETNHCLPFFKLFQLGASQIRLSKIDGEKTVFVDIPLEVNYKRFLACLAFSKRTGNTQVTHFHQWAEDCTKRIDLENLPTK